MPAADRPIPYVLTALALAVLTADQQTNPSPSRASSATYSDPKDAA